MIDRTKEKQEPEMLRKQKPEYWVKGIQNLVEKVNQKELKLDWK